MGKGVQFYNIQDLLEGFENTKASGWSVLDDKQFLTKGIGIETLETFLKLLAKGPNGKQRYQSRYTLRIYNKITDDDDIKDNTGADGSFNFLLSENDVIDTTDNPYYFTNRKNKLFERLEALEHSQLQIQSTINGTGEEDKPETISDVLRDPAKLQEYVNVFSQIRGLFTGNLPVAPQAAIGNVPTASPITDDMIERAQNAVSILNELDPKFLGRIEKLGRLAQKDKAQYDMLGGLLDNMNV